MANLVLLAVSLLIGSGICKPTDSDYSAYAYEVITPPQEESTEWSASEDDIVLSKRDLVVTTDNATANLTSEQTFLLADVISKVEGSLVQTAFEIVSLLQNNNETAYGKGDEDKEALRVVDQGHNLGDSDMTAHVSIDRVTVYLANSDNFPLIPTFQLPVHKQSEQNAVAKEHQESSEDKPLRLDSGNNSKQKRSVSTSTIPNFSNLEEAQKSTTETSVSHITKDTISTTSSVTGSTEATKGGLTKDSSVSVSLITSSESSTILSHLFTGSTTFQPPKSTPALAVSTSTASSTSTSSTIKTTTTTKNPVKELKETEEQLKAKVAEIQAEPIILSSRV